MATRKLGSIIALVSAATLAFAACGSDDSTSSDSDTTTTAGEATKELSVSDAWTRSTPGDAVRTAVYLTVESSESDEIVGVSVSSDIAGMAELHETTTDGMDDDSGDMDDDSGDDMDHGGGATTMQEVDSIPVAAGTTTLEPGGYHIMLMELAKPLTDGETFELALDFERAGSQAVTVAVQSG